MIKKMYIGEFKCLEKEDFEFKPLTILAGKNSSGKSSVLQSILIAARNCNPKNRERMYGLISKYQDLSYSIDIIHEEGSFSCTNISKSEQDETDTLLYENNLYYLTSNRIGQEDIAKYSPEYKVGNNGEFLFGTYDILVNKDVCFNLTSNEIKDLFCKDELYKVIVEFYKYSNIEYYENAERYIGENDKELIDQIKYLRKVSEIYTTNDFKNFCKDNLEILILGRAQAITKIGIILNAYFSYITDLNIILKIERITSDQVKVYFQQNDINKINPFNLGSGMSYLAKVLIICFLAKPGDVVMIENPEIHLHPKAQSRLGEFFAFLASKGIQLIIETHSEHLLDNLRYQIFKEKFSKDDVIIYYKDSAQTPFERIFISNDGHFATPEGKRRAFPKGFFDASLEQLLEIG